MSPFVCPPAATPCFRSPFVCPPCCTPMLQEPLCLPPCCTLMLQEAPLSAPLLHPHASGAPLSAPSAAPSCFVSPFVCPPRCSKELSRELRSSTYPADPLCCLVAKQASKAPASGVGLTEPLLPWLVSQSSVTPVACSVTYSIPVKRRESRVIVDGSSLAMGVDELCRSLLHTPLVVCCALWCCRLQCM